MATRFATSSRRVNRVPAKNHVVIIELMYARFVLCSAQMSNAARASRATRAGVEKGSERRRKQCMTSQIRVMNKLF